MLSQHTGLILAVLNFKTSSDFTLANYWLKAHSFPESLLQNIAMQWLKVSQKHLKAKSDLIPDPPKPAEIASTAGNHPLHRQQKCSFCVPALVNKFSSDPNFMSPTLNANCSRSCTWLKIRLFIQSYSQSQILKVLQQLWPQLDIASPFISHSLGSFALNTSSWLSVTLLQYWGGKRPSNWLIDVGYTAQTSTNFNWIYPLWATGHTRPRDVLAAKSSFKWWETISSVTFLLSKVRQSRFKYQKGRTPNL